MIHSTPFHKVLVANRGEIAVRVLRSARELGYATVAVYSKADEGALHVRSADEAVCIGAALPAESYLSIEHLIDAARRTGADAIHPGYGFLAESADFAQACAEAGIVFVGPSAQAMHSMGHKAIAKQLMLNAGVPCIPGYQGEDQSDERLAKEAERIGWPVMIKASAGGGGRGMRLVRQASDFAGLLSSARSEARHAFGNDEMLLERALLAPRHIEIQIMADRYGHAIYLGERDCSVQRRHQKLIEESPSPAVNADLRQRMGQAAVRAVQAITYEGAGTLEFLLDDKGAFYFMEMNTRLQVEHPVTEAVTGLDLVALQLRIAAGEALPLQQDDVQMQGHAMEVRLCAEDPQAQFMPQSGQLGLWRPSRQLRVDHGLNSSGNIAPYYDSMLAKLIAHGANREEARRRLLHGINDTVALGITTNQAFLTRCLQHPQFIFGAASTAFIEQHQAELLAADRAREREALALAAALLHAPTEGQRAHTLPLPLRLALGEATLALSLTHHELGCSVQIEDQRFELQWLERDGCNARLLCNGVLHPVVFQRDDDTLHLHALGQAWRITDRSLVPAQRSGAGAGDGKLRAAMNGRVVAVLVAVGERVLAGQALLTLEAMKMEHIHVAPSAGRIAAVHVSVGDQIGTQRLLVEIEL
jgi:geranyl-CoA carboxylase alpha subunit